MAPTKFVGLGTRVPGVAPLLEVNGQIRYTAIKIMAPQFTNGKMSVYEENGHCSLGVHGKTFKLFKVSWKSSTHLPNHHFFICEFCKKGLFFQFNVIFFLLLLYLWIIQYFNIVMTFIRYCCCTSNTFFHSWVKIYKVFQQEHIISQ